MGYLCSGCNKEFSTFSRYEKHKNKTIPCDKNNGESSSSNQNNNITKDKDEKINILINIMMEHQIENDKINKIISEFKLKTYKKGSICSISGKNYEEEIYNIVSKCYYTKNNIEFNTQTKEQLGGSSSKYDIICNFDKTTSIPIEIKKASAPDWTQRCLNYNTDKKWSVIDTNNKISEIFNNIIQNINIFNGNIPPFYDKKIIYEEWKDIKSKNDDFKDVYIDCPPDTIKRLYSSKGCFYIQISELGLYHLGDDICDFKVPEFICEQQLRIRIKVHSEKNKDGFCSLSTTISCQPKNLKSIIKSPFTLDNIEKLPENLLFTENNDF